MFPSACKYILILALLLAGCKDLPGPEQVKYLDGYWEIAQVEFPDGGTRDYPVNTTVDYYHLEGRKGYRKKLQPNADGTFATSDDALPLQVAVNSGGLTLVFEGDSGTWEEHVEALTPEEMTLLHSNGLRYRYRKYEPINLNP